MFRIVSIRREIRDVYIGAAWDYLLQTLIDTLGSRNQELLASTVMPKVSSITV